MKRCAPGDAGDIDECDNGEERKPLTKTKRKKIDGSDGGKQVIAKKKTKKSTGKKVIRGGTKAQGKKLKKKKKKPIDRTAQVAVEGGPPKKKKPTTKKLKKKPKKKKKSTKKKIVEKKKKRKKCPANDSENGNGDAGDDGIPKKRKKRRKLANGNGGDGGDGDGPQPPVLSIDIGDNSTGHHHHHLQDSKQTDDRIESDETLRSHRDEIHIKETKDAAAVILSECRDNLERIKIIDVSQSPRVTAARCESFINNLVHSNRMLQHKIDKGRGMCEFAAEPVKRQWEESFLHEPVGDQNACIKFKLGQCIATEMYSYVHGTDFTLREYFTPREMAELHADGNGGCGINNSNNTTTTINNSNGNSGTAAKSKRTSKKRPDCEGKTCLLCRRHDVLSAILVARSKGDQVASSLVLPNTANFVNVKGEYDLSNVVYNLPCRYEGLMDPVATVNQRYFEPFMHNGVRWLRQTIPYSKGEVHGNLGSNHF